jgi:spore coat protein U-like protein
VKSTARALILGLLAVLPLAAEAMQCSLPSGVSLAFGPYDDSSSASKDNAQSFTMSCCRTGGGTETATISIAIGKSFYSNQINTRQMKNSANADLMTYQLYSSSFGGTIWGDGVVGGSVFTQSVTTNANCIHPDVFTIGSPIYGRILPLQPVSQGSYSDTLIITVAP